MSNERKEQRIGFAIGVAICLVIAVCLLPTILYMVVGTVGFIVIAGCIVAPIMWWNGDFK